MDVWISGSQELIDDILENYNNSSETGKELILDVSTVIRKAHPIDAPTDD